MTFEELVARVGRGRYDEACRWAWRTAAGTGTAREGRISMDDLEDVPHELADLWYDAGTSLRSKLEVALRIYAEVPTYATLMYVKSHFDELDEELRRQL